MQYNHHYQNKKDNPFRISNKGLDHIDRYLTLKNKPHAQEHKYLAESDYRREEEERDRQLWVIEEIEVGKAYRIRSHAKSHLYLTLIKSQHLDHKNHEFLAEFAPLSQNAEQTWTLDLVQNRRFRIKIVPKDIEKFNMKQKVIPLYLESGEIICLKPGYKSVFLCKPKIDAQQKRRYLQFWKLSPLKQALLPKHFNREECLKTFSEKQRHLLSSFKGPIFNKHTPGYQYQVYQYATSSFPSEQMSPYLLAEPVDVEDIQIMIKMARLLCKKIVVRSGGHQYSGTSSGGDRTIVVSLNNFNHLKLRCHQGIVQIGPCNALRDVSKQLRDWGLSVPHGVCPLVNIGGHAQTGGYGNFTRSFGLLIDYVQAFDIVLADGTFKKISRPTTVNTDEQKLDLQIYRGVLGGNAGSFGIVTKFYIRVIKDVDHPRSYTKTVVRVFTKQLYQIALKEFQRWTNLIAEGNDESLRGLDLFFSLTQTKIEFTPLDKIPIMQLTGFYSDIDGGKPYSGQFEQVFKLYSHELNDIEKLLNSQVLPAGQHKLGVIAESYVVKFPNITESGRQFDYPYRKRGNVTVVGLTDQFIHDLTLQTERIPRIKSQYLVVQMIAGGGQHRQKGKRNINGVTLTSIPLRDLTHTFSLDIFYDGKKHPEAERLAEEEQRLMQETIEKHYSGKVGEKLFFWTSYGDLDMRKKEVVRRFYDSEEQYEVLQKLKQRVDPEDIFSSLMTVKLPSP